MSIRPFIITIICCLTSIGGQAQFWIEAESYPSSQTDFGWRIAIDNAGFIYRGGSFRETIDFGGVIHTSTGGNQSLYLTKHDSLNNLIWALKFQNTTSSTPKILDIQFDQFGSVYLVGEFQNSITFGSYTVNALSNYEAFIVKINPAGQVKWVNVVETINSPWINEVSWGSGVTIDSQGNSYMCGSFTGEGNFNGIQLISDSGSSDAFIAKYNPLGDIIYAKQYGGTWLDSFDKIIIGQNDSILVGGYIQDTVIFGNDTLINNETGTSNANGFFAKIDQAGNEVWAKQISGDHVTIEDIAIDASNNIYIAGDFRDSIIFPSATFYKLPTNAMQDCYLAKYDPNGTLIWAKHIQGKERLTFDDLYVKSNGTSYITGEYRDSTYFGNTLLEPPAGNFYSLFLAKCDSDGNFTWALKPSITAGSEGLGVTAREHKVFINGYIDSGTSTFGPDQVTASDADIVMVTAYDTTELVTDHTVSGNIYVDADSSCTPTPGDFPMTNILVKATPGPYYTITDSSGNYELGVNDGYYTIEQIIPQYITSSIDSFCPMPNHHAVILVGNSIDTTGFDFYNTTDTCINLSVDIASSTSRLCTNGTTIISYCNNSWFSVDNTIIYLDFSSMRVLQNSSHSYTMTPDSIYIFNLGTLQPGECGSITVEDSVTCDVNLLGYADCSKAWITPYNCPSLTVGWDQSDINVTGECNAGYARFIIKNDGVGNMADSSEIRVFKDAVLIHSQNYKLASGDSIILSIQADGQTIRLEADQDDDHPNRSQSNATIEACNFGQIGPVSLGYVVPFPQDDEAAYASISCLEIVGAYDPNIKQVFPTGVTSQHYIHRDQELEYLITFQNTGSDTAYDVHLIDTLPIQIDPTSLHFGASSHPYTVEVSGVYAPVIQFNFDSIYLPDSTTNPAGSIGFVQFYGSPYNGLPNGTVVENFADIYFDFNPPIRTDTPWVTLFDTTITSNDTILIVEGPLFFVGDTQICKGELVDLNAIGDSLIWWSLNGTDTITTGINLNMGFSSDTLIYLYSSNDSTTINIEVSDSPTFSLGNDTTICQGQTLTLSGNNFYEQYLWNTGDTSQSIVVDTTGTYVLSVLDSNQCQGSDDINIQVLDCTGILENSDFEFTITPNPATDLIYISSKQVLEDKGHLSIFNSVGKLVYRYNLTGSTLDLNINISQFESGIYTLVIQSGSYKGAKRIIIKS